MAGIPQPGAVVTVRDSNPPGLYALRDGLVAGDQVRLETFDRGWWTVARMGDGLRTTIFLANLTSVFQEEGNT